MFVVDFMYVSIMLTCGNFLFVEVYTDDSIGFFRKENSLVKPYNIGPWNFYGNTIITSNYVRLTANKQSQYGGIFNEVPVSMHSWEVHLDFKVTGSDGALFGDGLTFWYVNQSLSPGPVFGNIDYFKGLAIFLDTYSNHNGPHNHVHPYISAMINDGSQHYDHDRDGTHTEMAGCTAHFRNRPHPTLVAIRYHKDTIRVSTDIEGKGEFQECFKVDGVKLPTGYYFGVSAATGELADNHDIISLKSYVVDTDSDSGNVDYSKIEPSAAHHAPQRDHMDDNPAASRWTGFRIFLVIVLVLIGIGVCLVVGFLIYSRQEDRSKRFY